MNVVLVGLRGSGKSSLGRALADRLGKPFLDLDDLTPRFIGSESVKAAWERFGEAAFREAEFRALSQTLRVDGQVIALGGGTPTAPGAADLLRRESESDRITIVYLAADAATLRARLAATDNAHRPSLTGADPLTEVDAILAARDPLYRQLADEVIDTSDLDFDGALRELESVTA